MSEQELTLAESLRKLADLVDRHPEMAEWLRYTHRLGSHLFGKDAAQLDRFAELFGVDIEHDQEPNSQNGKFYSEARMDIGRLNVGLQCMTADYEKATGKTIERPQTGLPAEQLAELKHWAANPLPRDLGATS